MERTLFIIKALWSALTYLPRYGARLYLTEPSTWPGPLCGPGSPHLPAPPLYLDLLLRTCVCVRCLFVVWVCRVAPYLPISVGYPFAVLVSLYVRYGARFR